MSILNKKIGFLFGNEKMDRWNYYQFKPFKNQRLVLRILDFASDWNVETIGQLINHSEEIFLRKKNFGAKTYKYLKYVLSKHGLAIKDQTEETSHSTKKIGGHIYYVQHSSSCPCKFQEFEGVNQNEKQ